MNNDFPLPLNYETDLTVYEDYLKQNTNELTVENKPLKTDPLKNPMFLPAYLNRHIGKLVKIEALIGECLQTKIGTLYEIGADYIVIKLNQNCTSLVIDGKCIKFITIIHDNDNKSLGYY